MKAWFSKSFDPEAWDYPDTYYESIAALKIKATLQPAPFRPHIAATTVAVPTPAEKLEAHLFLWKHFTDWRRAQALCRIGFLVLALMLAAGPVAAKEESLKLEDVWPVTLAGEGEYRFQLTRVESLRREDGFLVVTLNDPASLRTTGDQ